MSEDTPGSASRVREGEDGKALLPALLQALNEGGLHTVAEVACRLNTSEPLVAAMADGLAQRGYLALLGGDCSIACDGCALSGACGGSLPNAARPRLLALTSKGRRAAEQQQS